jgi:hypothetical protein
MLVAIQVIFLSESYAVSASKFVALVCSATM